MGTLARNRLTEYKNFVTRQRSRNWMGGLENSIGGLESVHRGSMVGFKTVLKNTREGVHFLVKLPTISQQARKFPKNELLHIYFSRILA